MYNEFQMNKGETDESNECASKGICSVNPRLSALHEVVLLYIKELTFYLLKLKDLNVTNAQIKETIIDALSGILANSEYTQHQFQKMISELDEDINQSKALYRNFCEKHNMDIESVKSYFKHRKEFSITEAIKRGERYTVKKNNSFTPEQKNLYDIMLFLVKSMCIKIIELRRLGKNEDEFYYAVLSMLNIMNLTEFSHETVREIINNSIKSYYQLSVEVFHAQEELYGKIIETEVSFSSVPGKAILVSGSDYKKLENVLKAVEHTDINVYTHGQEMLMAHAFPKLKAHKNLKGHYGSASGTSVIDFAEFPGPILMTKLNISSSASLFRGRLFTLDPITSAGIITIKEHNYEPLLRSALESKGFIHGQEKTSIKVGFDEAEIIKKVDAIYNKMITGEIKHLYIIGLFNYPNSCDSYFDSFFKVLPKDCYAISLSCKSHDENVLNIDSFFDYSLCYKILKYLREKQPLENLNLSIFVSKCEKHTIAALLYLKQIGIKNLYVCKCPSILINPALMETLQESYDIKSFSNPASDIKATL